MQIDTNTKFGAEVECRLRDEMVIWLTTVRADGTPEPNPVWFYWDGSDVLIYGKKASHKLAHIRHDSHVSLNFNCTPQGGDVVVITGDATVDIQPLNGLLVPGYLVKYRSAILQLGMTPESFLREYNALIRVTPVQVRGHP